MNKKLAVLNVVGLTPSLIKKKNIDSTFCMPHLYKRLEQGNSGYLTPPIPAVTCTSQSTMLTGKLPQEHGVVGNGWYFKDLAEVGFWKQNNGLVQGEKIWEHLKKKYPHFTCAKLFWWYNMYSTADWSITPRPHYPADGRKVFDVYTHPPELKDGIKKDLGEFPFMHFWGPASGLPSSQWIADSARWVFKEYQPNLNLVYLPHLDYCLQQYGPEDTRTLPELSAIDKLVEELIIFYQKHGVDVLLVSEYGITPVDQVCHPNRILRKAGYLQTTKSLTWELLDCGASKAFAVADHQIAHVYVQDKEMIPDIVALFQEDESTQKVYTGEERTEIGLHHDRAGDIVLLAKPNAWYTYYYWNEEQLAPDFARCVDIHRKPGYDPVELFVDPKLKFPKLKIMKALLKKKLGFRYYMDVIPLQPELVRGSHGAPIEDVEEGPMYLHCSVSSQKESALQKTYPMSHIYHMIEQFFE
jgi:predicted AlkP superfamily pyrophosphatase or phosphodiesterase